MKQHNLLFRHHPWKLPLGILAVILGPIMLYLILRSAGISGGFFSGAVLLMAAKHLGLLAVILGPVYAFVRRRSRRTKPDDCGWADKRELILVYNAEPRARY